MAEDRKNRQMKDDKKKLIVSTTTVLVVLVACAACSRMKMRHGASQCPEQAIALFDGTDFSHWVAEDGSAVRWRIVDGAMEVVSGTGSIMTKQKFQSFKLHVEFNVPRTPPEFKEPDRGNSGVYLQRRYEVQILDSYGLESSNSDCGAIYRVKPPDRNVCKRAGQWQSYDISFSAARFEGKGQNSKKVKNASITVLHNETVIHYDVQIPSKTGAGQQEGPEPGPILLQDHGSKVRFRNIWLVPLD
jgi:hypothetical protein